MNYKNALLVIAIFLALISGSLLVNAHIEEGLEGHEKAHRADPIDYLPIDPFFIALYVFAIIIVLAVISIVFQNRMSEPVKKIFFIVIAVSVIAVTLYAAGSTVYLNVISESGGPIHWHADFEIWECNEQIINLISPEGLSNRIGSSVFHHHNDFRIHVEGLVINKEDVSLGNFFNTIGGEFDGTTLSLVLADGSTKTISNGDTCSDGNPGKWRLYRKNSTTEQFEENIELEKYIIQPHFVVPPGDFLLLVFDTEEGVPSGR